MDADVALLTRLVGDVATFVGRHWGQRPTLRSSGGGFGDLLSIDEVERLLLSSARRPSFRLVQDGTTLPPERSTSKVRIGGTQLDDVADLDRIAEAVDGGATLVLQGLQRTLLPLTDFCRSLERATSHPVQANAYLTPAGAAGLARHHDDHDVLVLQVAGSKAWKVDDLGAITMTAGDVLYLPAATAHAAEAQSEASLHLTVGLLRVTYRHVLRRALAPLPALDGALPLGYARPDQAAALAAELGRVLSEVATTIADIDAAQLAEAEQHQARHAPAPAGHGTAAVSPHPSAPRRNHHGVGARRPRGADRGRGGRRRPTGLGARRSPPPPPFRHAARPRALVGRREREGGRPAGHRLAQSAGPRPTPRAGGSAHHRPGSRLRFSDGIREEALGPQTRRRRVGPWPRVRAARSSRCPPRPTSVLRSATASRFSTGCLSPARGAPIFAGSASRTWHGRTCPWRGIAEGHADGRAILAELDRSDLAGARSLLGVWAAEPAALQAVRTSTGWRLTGSKRWCSGSHGLDLALVTAAAEDGPRLFAIDPSATAVQAGSWQPMGMARTDSHQVLFDNVELHDDAAVGGPNAYVRRPGFGHGGCGVAACWWGGALGVVDGLHQAVVNGADEAASALGRAVADLTATGHALRRDGDDRRRAAG